MTHSFALAFDHTEVLARIASATDSELDVWTVGVIGFDAETQVQRYNAYESRMAGLSVDRVIGHPLFTVVAPCMNNFMVAQRFEEAAATAVRLDATLDYVLTLRMRPVKVQLRLLADPAIALRYLLVQRKT